MWSTFLEDHPDSQFPYLAAAWMSLKSKTMLRNSYIYTLNTVDWIFNGVKNVGLEI